MGRSQPIRGIYLATEISQDSDYRYSYQIDKNILPADGIYNVSIVTTDRTPFGNTHKNSTSFVKNRIPTLITSPQKPGAYPEDIPEIGGKVGLKGIAVDPALGGDGGFEYYKLFYCTGRVILNDGDIPNIDVNPNTLDYGNVTQNSTQSSQIERIVTITNVGTSTLTTIGTRH